MRTLQVPLDLTNLERISRIYKDQVDPVGAHWFQGTKEDHFNQHHPLSQFLCFVLLPVHTRQNSNTFVRLEISFVPETYVLTHSVRNWSLKAIEI